jgi:putative transcriptional regulator
LRERQSRDLVSEAHVDKQGRGHYEVTNQGVDWLITQTDDLRQFVDHVSEDVIGQVNIEAAIATTEISDGEVVTLTMQDGLLRARAGDTGNATAVAVTDATAGQDVGITKFNGVVDYQLGTVTIVSVPQVQKGGSRAIDTARVTAMATNNDLVAATGAEATAVANAEDIEPNIRFGSVTAVQEAATKGLDVLLVASNDMLSKHTDKLREQNVSYELVGLTE